MKESFLTVGDVSKILERSGERVRQLERAGKLPALKTRGGIRLFRASDVQKFLRERQSQSVSAG